MGKCSVKLRHHPCYNTDGDGNLINHWQVSEGQSLAAGASANDAANAVVISGCNKHAVTVYEHGTAAQKRDNQHVYTFKDGYWETWNKKHCGNSNHQVDNEWLLGDEISSVNIEALPQDNLKPGGQVTYEIEISDNNHGYNTRLHGGDYTAWMYRPDGGGKHKDMPIGNGFNGYPCTNEAKSAIWTQSSAGTHGNPKRGQKMHCTFDINETKMKSLNEATKSNRDPRRGMYNAITQRICDGIWESNPDFKYGDGDKTCWDKKKSQTAIEKFCGGDNINNPSRKKHCNPEVIGQALYDQLAENYCKNNPDKEFCACYNVMQPGLCEQAPNLPGCKTVQPIWDKITESLDEGDIAQFEGMQPCYGSVCAGNVYQPTDWNSNCNRDISICKADFDIGGDLIDSNINLKQDCGNTNEGGDGGGTTTTNTEEEKSLIEKVFKLEEDKDKKVTEKRTTKIGGTVSSISSCFMCMIAIVLFT